VGSVALRWVFCRFTQIHDSIHRAYDDTPGCATASSFYDSDEESSVAGTPPFHFEPEDGEQLTMRETRMESEEEDEMAAAMRRAMHMSDRIVDER